MPTGSQAPTVRLTVDLDPDLHLKLRVLSVTRRESLQVMVTRLLREYVASAPVAGPQVREFFKRQTRTPSHRKEAKRKR